MAGRFTLAVFGLAVVLGSAALWAAGYYFANTSISAAVLVGMTVLAIVIARPDWCIRPSLKGGSWAGLMVALLLSAGLAAVGLKALKVSMPYDLAHMDLISMAPGVALMTLIEELLFRHGVYGWLSARYPSTESRLPVLGSAVAFGWAHMGPVFTGSPIGPGFYLLQSAYMLWVGWVLGQLRRATGAWTMPWLGHFAYNLAVLWCLKQL